MKRSIESQQKNKKSSNIKKSQTKISSFFSSLPKSTTHEPLFADIITDTTVDTQIHKKRKISDDLYDPENFKIQKCITDLTEKNIEKTCEILETTTLSSQETVKNAAAKEKNRDVFNEAQRPEKLSEPCSTVTALYKTNIYDLEEFFEEDWDETVNFNSFQRCNVIDIKKEPKIMILTVEHIELKCFATIMCLEYWRNMEINNGDTVMIQAKNESQKWIIDNNNGFIIIQPDTLISSTTIMGGLFCNRRAILNETYKKLESLPYLKSDQSLMIIGKLVHNIFQKALNKNTNTLADIIEISNNELQSEDTIYSLYISDVPFEKCKEAVFAYVPKIHEFIQHYVKGNNQQSINSLKDNFEGKIHRVHDIEENIWLPQLGIKGKIDVTAEVKINSHKKIIPIEIKTGRSSFSLEHTGQTILYVMMMALTGQRTDSGLLLYLRENIMREVTSGHAEKRDLIFLRNTLARYFNNQSKTKSTDSVSDLKDNWLPMKLPDPINHHSACTKCPYNTLCCAYLSKDNGIKLSESHPLTELSKEILHEFKSTHIDYVIKWTSILKMEEDAQSDEITVKNIWMMSPEKRGGLGYCICNLKVIGKVTEHCGKYRHTFVRLNGEKLMINNAQTEFVENQYVIVSTNKRINISAGFITCMEEQSITLLLDRDITIRNIDMTFHIDKYTSTNLFLYSYANVGGLLSDNDICKRLCSLVIDRKPATFSEELSRSIVLSSAKILQHLNECQQRAVLKSLTANDYLLIKGMPGTGKTEAIVSLIELLSKLKFSIIVTSHTHNAVDNILMKLIHKKIDFLRLGSITATHPSLKYKTENYLTSNCKTPEELEAAYLSKNIVGMTCLGAHHALFGKKMFDICIVDECTQVMQPIVLGPLYSARKFILVGDPDQLPPIIKSKTARKFGADESLFTRLDSENNTVVLTSQYRMNKNIMNLANRLTYNNKLKAGNKSIENATFISSSRNVFPFHERWLKAVLSPILDDSVIIVDTGCTKNLTISNDHKDKIIQTVQIYSNIWEAGLILRISEGLLQIGIEPINIGIIAPYKAHTLLLKQLVHKDIDVNTVDQYQGRDKDIILYSCVRSVDEKSDKKRDSEILQDHRRLTVAITRAKYKLIIIADKETIAQYSPFKKLFGLIQEKNIINVVNGKDDFAWDKLIDLL